MKQVCQKNETSTLAISLGGNTQVDEIASGTAFPEPKLQLGMIMRINGCEGTSPPAGKLGHATPNVLIDQSQLIILEDRLKVMERRNVALIAENQSLRMQLTDTSDKVRDLEVKYSNLLEKEQKKESGESHRKVVSSTLNLLEKTERGSQAWAPVCRLCERKFEGDVGVEATVIITKSELEILERDMETLRDALMATRQNHWDETAIQVKQQCYSEQLKRLAADAMAARQLADSRYGELERLAGTLSEAESNLRSAKKEITGLKITIAKLENKKRQKRELDGN